MSKLQAALAWAARGFPVFPLVANGKEPLYDGWTEDATTDPDAIRSMWTDPVMKWERDYNIGVLTTGRIVVDVDIKEGKDGHNQYMQLGGSYDTLVVQTPTGGWHCYFEGPNSSQSPIAKDVDIRSNHGYVLAPGSTIDGVPYRVVNDIEPAWVPIAVEKLLLPPYERKSLDVQAIDSAASIEAGIRFLSSTPVAIQGQRGDETTFITAARLVREMALSVDTAFALMRDHWNDRCVPPWELDELYHKVENASAYGTADLGRLDPSVLFSRVPDRIETPPTIFEQAALDWGNALDPATIPPRPWVIRDMLLLHEPTLIVAPGSAGKSSVSLAIVAHLAVGRDFGPYKVMTRCRSIVYNGEDDKTEQSRRLYAVCQSYNIDYEVVKRNVLLMSSDDIDMKLVSRAGSVPIVNEEMVKQFVAMASDPLCGLFVFDPLVDIHEVEESDSPQMNAVMRTIKRVCKQANVAGLILHHTVKAGNAKQEDRVGNVDISRGASGITNKVRIAFTLLNASSSDAEAYGMQESERHMWVRLDDAKMQYKAMGDNATWFRKEGIRLPSGDTVGVLKCSPLTKNTNHIRLRVAEVLASAIETANSASFTLSQAIAVAKAGEPLWSNKTDTDIKKTLEGMFATPIEWRGRKLQIVRDGNSPLLTLS